MGEASEADFLQAISQIFTRRAADYPNLLIGIGDDAAVTSPGAPLHVFTTDVAVEEVHFRRDWSSYAQIGARVTAANLADVVAMGAAPKYLLVSAVLPSDMDISMVAELAAGIENEAAKGGAIVIGGDLSAGAILIISITAIGEASRVIGRSGAKIGDHIAVSDFPGRARRGYESLLQDDRQGPFVSQFLSPVVDYERGLAALDFKPNAMCDISDGLISELGHLSRASHVGMMLEPTIWPTLPTSEFNFLNGGEDHVFLATFPDEIPPGWIKIGRVVDGAGVQRSDRPGEAVVHQGFAHFGQ